MASTKQDSILGRVGHVALAAALIATVLATPSAQAQTHNVLYSFSGGTDGATPTTGLTLDAAGNLYGTTKAGGGSDLGTVFKLDTAGNETVLHSFAGGADGATPYAGLVVDAAGNLYGTTSIGGASNSGTVFKVDTNGTETVLYSFTGGADGSGPSGTLIMDPVGNLYGNTSAGGASGSGTVFKVDTNGTETVLYTFTGGADGSGPVGGLVRDVAGNLYGMTNDGGKAHACFLGYVGCGVVFKLDPTGTETVLYTFTGGADGGNPGDGLALDASGNLYGTTPEADSNDGTVFKVDPAGTETVLHTFTCGDTGCAPFGGLVLDTAGNLYGTTSNGAAGFGTVFEVSKTGEVMVLHTFTGGADGLTASGILSLSDTTGNLYGITNAGGASNFGTVFEITPDFSLTASGFTPNPAKAGGASTSTLNISALSAFNGTVALSCSVLPSSATCSISPSSITAGTPATLTVTTTRTNAGGFPAHSGSALYYALSLPLIGVVAIEGFGGKRRKKGMGWVLACMLSAGVIFGVACGGGSTGRSGGGGGTTYTVTLTGASVPLQHSTSVTLTVQ